MIERVDQALWSWGDWVRSDRSGSTSSHGLVMSYQEQTPPGFTDAENEQAAKVDQAIAQMPGHMKLPKRSIKQKDQHALPNHLGAKELKLSQTLYKQFIDQAHAWLDARLF